MAMNQSEGLYHQTTPVVLPQDQPQNDAELEPIDLEEVQKIQARMPAADPNAPIGSNKNPIRIIQQGNQYITTQDVSDEQLQQIIQVLTNQALISSSGTRPSAIYNRLTNRRIIFRVTRAKRRNDENNSTGSIGNVEKSISSSFSKDKRSMLKKRRRTSDNEDPDFEPEVPEEEVLPFPLSRRSAVAGRISKPPKHLVKDYKHLRPEDLTTKQDSSDEDEHSDGGYSDYINDGLMSEENWSDDGIGDQFNCNICQKGFGTRAGLARHHTLTHGPNHARPRGRWANPYMASVRRRAKLKEVLAEATDDDLVEFVAPRLAKLTSPWDHLLMRSEQGNPPLPQVHRLVSEYLSLAERVRAFLGDQLVAKPRRRGQASTNGGTKTEKGSEDAVDNGEGNDGTEKDTDAGDDDVDDSEDEDRKVVITVTGEDQSSALCLPIGKYTVQGPLREEYLPRRFRSVLIAQRAGGFATAGQVSSLNANSTAMGAVTNSTSRISITSGGAGEHPSQTKRALVAMETVDDDDGVMALRQDANADGAATLGANNQAMGSGENVGTAIGDELVLLSEGGLGGPVPDAWLESGAFLAVLTETGQTSELVMEAATGRLFHRPTGHLVSLSDGQQPVTSTSIEEEEEEHQQQQQQAGEGVATVSSVGEAGGGAVGCSAGKASDEGDEVPQMAGDAGEVIDLNTLFPGVTVTEVSAGVCLVTKPNGDRFNVEHGGEGITLETLQAILQM